MDLPALEAILSFAGLLPSPSPPPLSSGSSSGEGDGRSVGGPASSASSPPIPPALAALLPTAHARDAFRRQVRSALELVGSVLALFPLEQLALTFNGGKDACVVFYLVRAAVAARALRDTNDDSTREAAVAAALRRVAVLYFAPKHGEFPEVAAFMDEVARGTAALGQGASGDGGGGGMLQQGESRARARARASGRGLGCAYTVFHVGYQEGMRELVEGPAALKAVFMGVRAGDPYSLESEHVQPSSPGWPPFLRVNAILKWDYGHVWAFLRGFGLPYCALYDQGYTSIGDVRTTVRNPALLKPQAAALFAAAAGEDGGGDDNRLTRALPSDPALYRPAFELEDYTLERANRTPQPMSSSAGPKKKGEDTATVAAKATARPLSQAEPALEPTAKQKQQPQQPQQEQPPPPASPAPIEEESLDASGSGGGGTTPTTTTKAITTTAAAAGGLHHHHHHHHRKRGSFCERLPVALVCVGDFLSHRDSAPMALAHELRELRCRVAPLAVVPQHPTLLAAQLSLALALSGEGGGAAAGAAGGDGRSSSSDGGAGGSAPAVVFVLGIDEDAHDLAAGVIADLLRRSDDGDEDDDDAAEGAEGGRWRQATAHVESCGRVFLLAPAFARGGGGGVPLEAQKAELDALLDSIAATLPPSLQFARSSSAASSSSSSAASPPVAPLLPPDPVVVVASSSSRSSGGPGFE